jgi:hypothetical protein
MNEKLILEIAGQRVASDGEFHKKGERARKMLRENLCLTDNRKRPNTNKARLVARSSTRHFLAFFNFYIGIGACKRAHRQVTSSCWVPYSYSNYPRTQIQNNPPLVPGAGSPRAPQAKMRAPGSRSSSRKIQKVRARDLARPGRNLPRPDTRGEIGPRETHAPTPPPPEEKK